MGETRETQLFVQKLNNLGPHVKFIVKEARVTRGHADVFGCINGLTFIIENKTEDYWKNRPGHALQLRELENWEEAGAVTLLLKTCLLYTSPSPRDS